MRVCFGSKREELRLRAHVRFDADSGSVIPRLSKIGAANHALWTQRPWV